MRVVLCERGQKGADMIHNAQGSSLNDAPIVMKGHRPSLHESIQRHTGIQGHGALSPVPLRACDRAGGFMIVDL